jgi:hypothetical protein
MKDNIFSLVYSDYDTQDQFFFIGPVSATQEEFAKLCDRLLPKAGYRVVNKYNKSDDNSWICWRDVVESLVSLLEEQGYQRISLEGHELQTYGSIIGLREDTRCDDLLGFSGPLITEYNRKLEKKMAEERKTKRKLGGLMKKRTIQIIK